MDYFTLLYFTLLYFTLLSHLHLDEGGRSIFENLVNLNMSEVRQNCPNAELIKQHSMKIWGVEV
jgi:hypothetical protein